MVIWATTSERVDFNMVYRNGKLYIFHRILSVFINP